ncbi:hypothetical protein ABIE52_000408 [Rhodococcus sp. OAS809]
MFSDLVSSFFVGGESPAAGLPEKQSRHSRIPLLEMCPSHTCCLVCRPRLPCEKHGLPGTPSKWHHGADSTRRRAATTIFCHITPFVCRLRSQAHHVFRASTDFDHELPSYSVSFMPCSSQILPPRRSRTVLHALAKTVRRQYRGGRGCLQTARASNWPRRSPFLCGRRGHQIRSGCTVTSSLDAMCRSATPVQRCLSEVTH